MVNEFVVSLDSLDILSDPSDHERFQRMSPRGATMTDLTNPRLIYAKGWLFLLGGIVAAGLLILDRPTLRTAGLLAICVWCFCRWYYFAFYVIEHYIDGSYRFAGLSSFVRYLLTPRRSPNCPPPQES